MKSIIARGMCTIALSAAATGVNAQESTNRVAASTDWSVFVEDNPKECWAVSIPKETVNTKNGRAVAVTRGDILLMVSYRPSQNVAGEVYFTGGYPYASGATVSLNVSGTVFELFTQGEDAWPATPSDDVKIITAMKRGADALATGTSSRGTKTEDKFSLLGFTAAVEEAAKRCGN